MVSLLVEETGVPKKITDLPKVTDKLSHNVVSGTYLVNMVKETKSTYIISWFTGGNLYFPLSQRKLFTYKFLYRVHLAMSCIQTHNFRTENKKR